MSTEALSERWIERAPRAATWADSALNAAARFWFAVAVAGQWAFLYYILAFYGPSTLTGNFKAWSRNKFLLKGYVAGDTVGNLFFAAHVLLAAVVTFGGALQLVPQIRARALAFHRWNGRVFLVTAMAASLAGLHMVWVRGSTQNLDGAIAITINTALILAFAVLAWRSAAARDIAAHRRWALRAYLAANGVWFIRVGLFAWALLSHGHIGIFDRIWSFGCYLLPLGVLELYLRAKRGGGPGSRLAVAGGLFVSTVLMGVGIVGVYLALWRPLLQ